MGPLVGLLPAIGASAGGAGAAAGAGGIGSFLTGSIPLFSTMTAAGPAQFSLSVPGTISALGAVGKFMQGQQQAAAAEYNAELLERQALYEEQASAAEANRLRRRGRRILGAQRAAYGASGVLSNEGSPLLVMENTAEEIEMDAQRTLFSGDVRAAGSRGKAKLSRWDAKRRRGSALLGAGTYLGKSLLTQSR